MGNGDVTSRPALLPRSAVLVGPLDRESEASWVLRKKSNTAKTGPSSQLQSTAAPGSPVQRVVRVMHRSGARRKPPRVVRVRLLHVAALLLRHEQRIA